MTTSAQAVSIPHVHTVAPNGTKLGHLIAQTMAIAIAGVVPTKPASNADAKTAEKGDERPNGFWVVISKNQIIIAVIIPLTANTEATAIAHAIANLSPHWAGAANLNSVWSCEVYGYKHWISDMLALGDPPMPVRHWCSVGPARP